MPSWLPSITYPPSQHGYWEPMTSTINWCEEDYYATIYSAEIVNTLTNLVFPYLAFRGIYSCIKHGHDRIFLITFIGYFLVGTGSFFFHATLKYPMQLLDELSMIYTTCLSCFAVFSYRQSNAVSALLAAFLISLSIFITAYYHYLKDPGFHQSAYALLTATVLLRSMYIMEVTLRPSLRRGGGLMPGKEFVDARSALPEQERKRQDERDERTIRTMWALILVGLTVFLSGFGIWNLDNIYCTTIRRWRREIGLPWGIFLEGHGWWHLMTGTGAYFFIIWGIWLRHCANGRQDEYELVWPSTFTSIPIIVKQKPRSTSNGFIKKTS